MVAQKEELSLPSEGRLSRIRGLLAGDIGRWGALSLLFFVTAIVQTWPLLVHMTDSIADSPSAPLPDIYAFLWNLSWVKQAIVDLHTNPYQTDYIFYPNGEHLYIHPLAFVNGVMSIPLQVATGNLILSWNILALLFFTFSGLATYALAYRITQNHLAAIFAGFVFAFAPVVMMQFNGRWHISTVWPIPLMALFTLRFLDTERYREAAAAGVCWALLLYNNQEFALDAAVFFTLFFSYWSVVYLARKEGKRFWRLVVGGAVVIAVWFAISSPLLIPAAIDAQSGNYDLPAQDEYYSGTIRSLITPSPLWGPGENPALFHPQHDPVGSIENTLYLGAVPLIFATVALFAVKRAPHRVAPWWLLFLLFVILSLGPWLYWDETHKLSVPLPYQIYDDLPLFGDRRVPARMLPFGMLGLAIVSAVGIDFAMSRLGRRYVLLAPALGLLALGLVSLEYWSPPVHTTRLDPPNVLEQIRDEPGDFAVLDVPLGRRDGELFNGSLQGAAVADYYQSVYKKRVFGGFIARLKESTRAWLGEEPGIQHFALPNEAPTPRDLDTSLVREVLRKYRVKYIVLHKIGPHDEPIDSAEVLNSLDAYIRGIVGEPVSTSDPSLIVYRNHDVE